MTGTCSPARLGRDLGADTAPSNKAFATVAQRLQSLIANRTHAVCKRFCTHMTCVPCGHTRARAKANQATHTQQQRVDFGAMGITVSDLLYTPRIFKLSNVNSNNTIYSTWDRGVCGRCQLACDRGKRAEGGWGGRRVCVRVCVCPRWQRTARPRLMFRWKVGAKGCSVKGGRS